ncbi:discoidin domain-containing protein [Paenibacillus sp. FSL P4-0113]|uniref:discoidin domain-containing protein n=1 Tax=Paenibacillus sp. FSL P4-0113 TaxID=2921630 RepID=UPI0030F8EAE7
MKKTITCLILFGLLISLLPIKNVSASESLVLTKSATASSVEDSSKAADFAIDGNSLTRWSSQYSDPQWISVDLGNTTEINGVTLNWEAAYAKSFQVQTSTDNDHWATVYSTTTGEGGIEKISFEATNARYVRMNGIERATGYGYSPLGIRSAFSRRTGG